MTETGPEKEKNLKSEYSGTISSNGRVLAKPDRYSGTKYSFGASRTRGAKKDLKRRKATSVVMIQAGNESPVAIAKAIIARLTTSNRAFVVKATNSDEIRRAFKGVSLAQERLSKRGIRATVTFSPEEEDASKKLFRLALEPAAG